MLAPLGKRAIKYKKLIFNYIHNTDGVITTKMIIKKIETYKYINLISFNELFTAVILALFDNSLNRFYDVTVRYVYTGLYEWYSERNEVNTNNIITLEQFIEMLKKHNMMKV